MNKFVIFAVLMLAGCAGTGVVCNEPYIAVGESCCLDKDANSICDSDEREAQEPEEILDCSACPPNIITETEVVEVTKYVCSDGRTVVQDPEDCLEAMQGPEVSYTPVMTNEEDQPVIDLFTIRPACRGGFQAMEIHFVVGTAANDFVLQGKTAPEEKFSSLFEFASPVFDKYLYGVFCEGTCTSNADFFISPGEKYLIRGKFDMRETSWEQIFYTNEHVVDATPDGEYMTKLC